MGDDAERTCYVNGLHDDVTSELIEELFTQAGPLVKVIWKDEGYKYALVIFEDEESVPFAIETLDEILMFGKPIAVKPKNGTEQYKKYEEWQRSRPQHVISPPSSDASRSGGRRDRNVYKEHREGIRPVREDNWRQARTPNSRSSRGHEEHYERDNWHGERRYQNDPRDLRRSLAYLPPPPPPPPPGYREPRKGSHCDRDSNRDHRQRNGRGFGGPNVFNNKRGGGRQSGGGGW